MKQQSFSIDFIIRKCKVNKKRADIFAKITVDGEIKELSIKEQIDTADWVSKQEIVKGRSIETKAINQRIDDVRFQLKEKYRELEKNVELITAETVRNAYLGMQVSLNGRKLRELMEYYRQIWEEKLKPGGFKNYKTTIKYVELFLDSKDQLLKSRFPDGDIYLSQVTPQFATDLEHYIRTTPIKDFDPCKGNGVGKHVQRFKRILNWAEKEIKWIKKNQCSDYSCPIKKSKRKKLDMQELVKIETKNFTDPTLNYVKTLFINSSYTGFAFADAMAIEETDFEWNGDKTVWCKLYRTKSEELCSVPLLEIPSKILNEYREDAKAKGRKTIFPKITNKHVNECLKIIQAACEIPTLLTFHVARHTFAKTVALKNGIPLETVQMKMGHTKITTTQIYADVDEEKIVDDLEGIEEKLQRRKNKIIESQKKLLVA